MKIKISLLVILSAFCVSPLSAQKPEAVSMPQLPTVNDVLARLPDTAPVAARDKISGQDLLVYDTGANKTFRAFPNYLTLNNTRSVADLDWQTPATLVNGFLRNKALMAGGRGRRAIGHVSFELFCEGMSTPVLTGETSVHLEKMFAEAAKNHSLLGPMFYTVQGRLEKHSELDEDLSWLLLKKPEQVNFLTFRLSKDACLAVRDYFEAFKKEQVYSRYGMTARPMYKEGGECAAVASSLVEAAGVPDFSGLTREWYRTIYVTDSYLRAGGLSDQQKERGLRTYRWLEAPASGSYRTGVIYDPTMINDWVRAVANGKIVSPRPYRTYMIRNSVGIALDYTDLPVPAKIWWKGS